MASMEPRLHRDRQRVVALLGHPDQLDRLRRDPSGWPVAVHELMRLWSPVPVAQPRYATEDVEQGGVVVRAGDAAPGSPTGPPRPGPGR